MCNYILGVALGVTLFKKKKQEKEISLNVGKEITISLITHVVYFLVKKMR